MNRIFLLILATLFLAGCADSVSLVEAIEMERVGFFSGLIHGLVLPFSWFFSLFTDIAIYAIYNNGGWYDFGFFVGASSALGGGTTVVKR